MSGEGNTSSQSVDALLEELYEFSDLILFLKMVCWQ
jgi:hypothetical protein